MATNIKKKYTGLLFGEGRKDKKFLYTLTCLDKFQYHTKNWVFRVESAHGCSAMDILGKCIISSSGVEKLIICFIDSDDLKNDYPNNWEDQKKLLENQANENNIKIIWQIDNAEEEFIEVLGAEYKNISKHKLNKEAMAQIDKFINSE